MSEDLPPFFSPPENNGSDRELSSEQAKRPLTPAPSIEKSQESPAPMVVVRNQKSSIATALFAGLVVGSLVVGSMWFYQNRNTYTYKVQSNSSVLEKPRDVQEVLSKVEPATVAVNVDGGVAAGGSAGTGFVISSDGITITNNHVIAGVKKGIEVTLNDGRTLSATLLGRDPLEDLAVLKVDATGLPTVKLGNSSETKVGDDVIAIGNALALEGGLSVTRGIVSGLSRTIDTELNFQLQGIIQTDAAINRGNSGGPLVNSRGEVVGINTAIANPTFAQNVGFAIAIDRAKPIIEDLKQGKDRKIAYLGVAAQDVNERLVKELNLKVPSGAIVVEIVADSPASKSSLALGDVIVEIAGEEIKSANDMVSVIRDKKPGQKVVVKYDRRGSKKTTNVTLVERPL